MPNNNYMDELRNLKNEAMGVIRVENAYNVLLGCKGICMHDIHRNIMIQLNSNEVSEGVKYFLAWALTNISAGLSMQEYDESMKGMKEIADSHKMAIEDSLISLFNSMMNSGNDFYSLMAKGYMAKAGETSLFDQVIAEDAELKQMYEEITGEEFPGFGGRGQ